LIFDPSLRRQLHPQREARADERGEEKPKQEQADCGSPCCSSDPLARAVYLEIAQIENQNVSQSPRSKHELADQLSAAQETSYRGTACAFSSTERQVSLPIAPLRARTIAIAAGSASTVG
jgi:hypothetical protein